MMQDAWTRRSLSIAEYKVLLYYCTLYFCTIVLCTFVLLYFVLCTFVLCSWPVASLCIIFNDCYIHCSETINFAVHTSHVRTGTTHTLGASCTPLYVADLQGSWQCVLQQESTSWENPLSHWRLWWASFSAGLSLSAQTPRPELVGSPLTDSSTYTCVYIHTYHMPA